MLQLYIVAKGYAAYSPCGKAALRLGVLNKALYANMTKLELTYVSVKCGTVDPDKNSFLN